MNVYQDSLGSAVRVSDILLHQSTLLPSCLFADIAVCPSQEDVELYMGSSFKYTWTEIEAGDSQQNLCPGVCMQLASYPEDAIIIRTCAAVEGGAEWEIVDHTGCGLNTAAFRLCEANQVFIGTDFHKMSTHLL